MNKPPTPELAFRLGAEARRTHLAAWAMSKGLTPVAIDILNMGPPPFSVPESMTIGAAPVMREGCDYVTTPGALCQKCGRAHDA